MKKIAVMQPYFYPYVGYFDLIKNVDYFVFLTDVQFTRRSWISRNKIRSHQKKWQYIHVPTLKAPQKTLIHDVLIVQNWIEHLNSKLLHTFGKKIEKHPIYLDLQNYKDETNLCRMLCNSVIRTASYLNITTKFLDSRNFRTTHEKNQNGIIEIVKNLGGTIYINACGGRCLYQKDEFEKHNIKLDFMPDVSHSNKLSILDLIFGDKI